MEKECKHCHQKCAAEEAFCQNCGAGECVMAGNCRKKSRIAALREVITLIEKHLKYT